MPTDLHIHIWFCKYLESTCFGYWELIIRKRQNTIGLYHGVLTMLDLQLLQELILTKTW